MKTKIILFLSLSLIFLLLLRTGWGQTSIPPVNNNKEDVTSNLDVEQTSVHPVNNTTEVVNSNFDVEQVSFTKWNSEDGIPYARVPGANLGATSFHIIDENNIAFLSDPTGEIIILDKNNMKITKKIPVVRAPRDFVYDNGFFYVLGELQVVVYDLNGIEKNKIIFPDSYASTARLTRFANSIYLLLSAGNSIKIESDGIATTPQQFKGWITSTGIFVYTQLNGDNSYSVKIIRPDGKISEKSFLTDKKTAGVFVIGTTKDRIFFDVQTIISEIPIAIERYIVSINFKEAELGTVITSIKVPDSYYVLSNKDLYVSADGKILNMVTAPQGVYVFSLTETNSKTYKGYPESLLTSKYHFNDDLIDVE